MTNLFRDNYTPTKSVGRLRMNKDVFQGILKSPMTMRSLMETNPQLQENISQHLLTERTSLEGSEVPTDVNK